MIDEPVEIDQFEIGDKVREIRHDATLYDAVDKRTGAKVILKLFTSSRTRNNRELGWLHVHRYPLLVELVAFGCCEDGKETHGFMALKPAPYLTLEDALTSERKGAAIDGWDATSKSKCVFGLAAAISLLHSKNFPLRQLNPSVVQLDEHLELVLNPFDAREMEYSEQNIDSWWYLAPEQLKGELDELNYEGLCAADVFAFAVCLYRFFTDSVALDNPRPVGRSPFASQKRVVNGERLARVEEIPDSYWDLITRCWDAEADKRPSAKEIVEQLHENTENYIFPGADLAAVKEYESRIIAAISQGE